jgi:enamine deaminase RidA (YjgF/YER057c/UK114 family)
MVFVSGTTGTDEHGKPVGDLSAQVRYSIEKIQRSLDQAGASLADVVRTRMFVTDISRWEEMGRIHGEFFGEFRPATSMVEVSRLIGEGIEFEIEAVAVVD